MFIWQAWGSESTHRICWGVWKCGDEKLCVELGCISFSFSKLCSLSCSNNLLPFPLFHSLHLSLLSCSLYSRWTSKSLHVIRRGHICDWKWNEWQSDEGWSGREMVGYVKIYYYFYINFQNKSFFHFSSMDIWCSFTAWHPPCCGFQLSSHSQQRSHPCGYMDRGGYSTGMGLGARGHCVCVNVYIWKAYLMYVGGGVRKGEEGVN